MMNSHIRLPLGVRRSKVKSLFSHEGHGVNLGAFFPQPNLPYKVVVRTMYTGLSSMEQEQNKKNYRYKLTGMSVLQYIYGIYVCVCIYMKCENQHGQWVYVH